MAEPYVGEIRMFGGNFPPLGWAMCDGQLMSISENDTLFNLIGTTYGGDGQSTFGMPDLRGRVPSHQGSKNGQTYIIGQITGVEAVTLSPQQLPQHTHPLYAASTPGAASTPTTQTMISSQGPGGTVLFAYQPYNAANEQVALSAASTTPSGGNQPHENMQPYLGINFIISLYGVYPSPS
ncbi:phage tail protein [Caulobacter sp. LjRoot300]|uniref:phage tail protein n=1 Tax=Caulobacter sp. LjRoot300 TaxID=3342321 RepID=UPI003ED0B416